LDTVYVVETEEAEEMVGAVVGVMGGVVQIRGEKARCQLLYYLQQMIQGRVV
jgi:hypothetical protein